MAAANLSYWEHQSFFGPHDVAIIGAGLVGLTAALYLKQRRPAWRVMVLERGPLPSGASTKNAGFACFGSISELLEQEKRGDLLAVVAARCEGLARLRELVGDAELDYQPVGGYELFRREEAALATECRGKIAYFNALLAPVVGQTCTFRDASDEANRFGFGGLGALLKNEHEGSLDAGRMMRALLARTWAADIPVLQLRGGSSGNFGGEPASAPGQWRLPGNWPGAGSHQCLCRRATARGGRSARPRPGAGNGTAARGGLARHLSLRPRLRLFSAIGRPPPPAGRRP